MSQKSFERRIREIMRELETNIIVTELYIDSKGDIKLRKAVRRRRI